MSARVMSAAVRIPDVTLRRGGVARRLSRAAALAGACGAAGLAGCGATGANLAETDGGAKSWWSPPAALVRATSLTPPGLVADPIPSTRGDLNDAAALDLAYANLRSGSQATAGSRDEAEAAYARVLKDDPKHVEALIGVAHSKEIAAGDRPGELDAAEDAYRRAAEAAPADARPLLALGRFQAVRKRWEDSAATYGRAVSLAADTTQRRTAEYGLAVAMSTLGDIEGSRPHFIASVGEASAHFNMGELYRRDGDRSAAIREFRLAAARNDGQNPHLAQVDAMIAALEATAPTPNASPTVQPPAAVPARPTDGLRLAAARPTVTRPTADRPTVDPFDGNPSPYGRRPAAFAASPSATDRVRPASSLTSAPAVSPAAYVPPAAYAPAATTRPAPAAWSTARPAAPVAPPAAYSPATYAPAADPDVPPPWPFPSGG